MLARVGGAASELAEKRSEESDFSSGQSDEGTIECAGRLLRLAAGVRMPGEGVKSTVARAARATGFSYTRARDIWYGDARRIDASEMDALRRLERERAEKLRAIHREKLSAIEQLAALRARLQTRDADFHKPDIDAIDFALERMRE